MKQREERWLEERLRAWTSAGLLTGEQAAALRAHEISVRREPLSGFTVLAALGGLSIALGCILVVAYNWEEIPYGLRIGGFLILLGLVGELSMRLNDRFHAWRSAAQVMWLVLPLAGIGLVAQVYHLSGDPLRPLLAWALLAWPVAHFSHNRLADWIHSAGIVCAIFVGTFERNTILSLTTRGSQIDSFTDFVSAWGVPLAGSIALWSIALFRTRARLGSTPRLLLVTSGLTYLGALGAATQAFSVDDPRVGITLAGAMTPLFWACRRWMAPGSRLWEVAGYLGTAALPYALTFLWDEKIPFHGTSTASISYAATIVCGGVLALAVAERPWMRSAAHSWRPVAFSCVALAPLVLAALLYVLPESVVAVLANLTIVGIALNAMATGVRENRPGPINIATSLIGILLVTRFIDYFGSMLESGSAFIATGVLFIGLAWLLNRGRNELLSRAQGENAP